MTNIFPMLLVKIMSILKMTEMSLTQGLCSYTAEIIMYSRPPGFNVLSRYHNALIYNTLIRSIKDQKTAGMN